VWISFPTRQPKAAPMNNVGVNTPPTAPEPKDAAVAMNLQSNTIASVCQSQSVCRIELTTL